MKANRKIPYIDPDNVMPQEDMDRLSQYVGKGSAVVEISEGETMPLAIYGADCSIAGVAGVNVMMSIIHHVKSDMIEMRGRARFEQTGNKQNFSGRKKLKNTKVNYDKMMKFIEDFVPEANSQGVMRLVRPSFLLEFEVGASAEDIMVKMERSNNFNIGVMDNPKK